MTKRPLDNLASSIIKSISFLFPVDALKVRQGIFKSWAKAIARVVLPQPGGPYKITDIGWFFSTNLVNKPFSPIMCFCPNISKRDWGLIL